MLGGTPFHRAGSALVSGPLSGYQVANWATHEAAVVDHYMSKAMNHYTKAVSVIKSAEFPEPCLFKGRVAFRGGLKPRGVGYPPPGFEYVFMARGERGEYELANMEDIKPITNDIYFKKVAPLLENYIPTIVSRERRKGMMRDEKDRYAIVKFKKVK
jgi:hypothetical protein